MGLENLSVHKMARDLAIYIYEDLVPKLPDEEKWGLISQIRRSAISIPANMAESYGRFYFQENIRFCYNARGSLEELFSHLIISKDLNYLAESEFVVAEKRISDLRKALNGYIRFLKNKKKMYSGESGKKIIREYYFEDGYRVNSS
jgi:four helix bundle protein